MRKEIGFVWQHKLNARRETRMNVYNEALSLKHTSRTNTIRDGLFSDRLQEYPLPPKELAGKPKGNFGSDRHGVALSK
jgi:hypothetical protein